MPASGVPSQLVGQHGGAMVVLRRLAAGRVGGALGAVGGCLSGAAVAVGRQVRVIDDARAAQWVIGCMGPIAQLE